MYKILRRPARAFFITILLFTFFCQIGFTQEAAKKPSLPLPELTAETSQLKNWSAGRPVVNSIRAWHYVPEMVQPLLEVG